MRNRRNSNVKNIKDYIVPIITFGLIFILIYLAFSGGDNQKTTDGNNVDITQNSMNEISLLLGKNSTVMILNENDKKRVASDTDRIIPGETLVVEKGDISFSIPNEAKFSLNQNGELKYAKDSQLILNSSSLWIEAKNDVMVSAKFAKVKIGKNSVVNVEQNEVATTVYLLQGSTEVENLAGISTFLSPGKQLKISNKDAMKEDIDLVMLKEDFDDYFKISDWYLQNNGSIVLEKTSNDLLLGNSGSSTLGDNDSILSLSGSIEKKKILTTSQLLNFDKIYDEGSVSTPIITVSGKFADERINYITIQGKEATINQETKTFSVANINTNKQANDVIIKVFDKENNIIAKYLYTLYYSGGKVVGNNNGFAKINTSSYPVNGEDFIISIPSVKAGETYSSENTFYGTVKNPDVVSVYVNGYKLKTFNGKTFRYHAYSRFKTLGEGVNNYEIKYLGKDGKVILKKYVTINKKTKAKSVVPTNVSSPKEQTQDKRN